MVELNSKSAYDSLKNEMPVVVTKKRVSPLQVEGYPPAMIIEYRSINPSCYGVTGKIKIRDAYLFMAIGVGDTLETK